MMEKIFKIIENDDEGESYFKFSRVTAYRCDKCGQEYRAESDAIKCGKRCGEDAPLARTFPARLDSPNLKRRVRGIIRRRNSDSYANLMLPTMLRIKWKQEEKLKNALLYGIGVPKPKNEFWGESEIDPLREAYLESDKTKWSLSPEDSEKCTWQQVDPEKLRLHNLLWVYREIVRSLLHECNKHGIATLQKIAIQDALDPDELKKLGEAVWSSPGKEAPHATTKTNSPGPASEHEPDESRG